MCMKRVELLKSNAKMRAGEMYQVCTVDEKHHGMWISDEYGHMAFVQDEDLGEIEEDEE